MAKGTGRFSPCAALLVLVVLPDPAEAFELNGGVSAGWIQAGTIPHLAIGPRASMLWRNDSGLLFSVHDLCSILPPSHQQEAGVYNQTSVDVGYDWKDGNFSVGPSIATYSMVTCGVTLCSRVNGIGFGGHAQTNIYVAGSLGLSVVAELDYLRGNSLVLPGGMAVMIAAGPVMRWGDK